MRSGFNNSTTLPVNGHQKEIPENGIQFRGNDQELAPAEILFITSHPPRECGIATY